MSTNAKALKVSAVLIFVYFFAEIFVALVTGSLSLFADAAHELSTVVAITISLVAMRLASRPATAEHTFGLLRAEALGHLVVDGTADQGAVLLQAKGLLDETYGFSLSTIQVELGGLSESSPDLLEYQHPDDRTASSAAGTNYDSL